MKILGLILFTFFAFSILCNAQTKKVNSKLEYIEIAKFKLKEGFTTEQFIDAEKDPIKLDGCPLAKKRTPVKV